MAQCFMAGMTSYENQSLSDISEDITHWITYSEETKNDIHELLSKLKDTAFYSHIPYDYKAMIHEMPRICQTNIDVTFLFFYAIIYYLCYIKKTEL